MNIDERIEALTMNLELAFRDIEAMRANVERLVGVVETLAAVAQNHERRLTSLEGGPAQ